MDFDRLLAKDVEEYFKDERMYLPDNFVYSEESFNGSRYKILEHLYYNIYVEYDNESSIYHTLAPIVKMKAEFYKLEDAIRWAVYQIEILEDI